MCPATFKLAFHAVAWCMSPPQWVDIAFCLPNAPDKHGIACVKSGNELKSVNVEMATVKGREIFVIDRCDNVEAAEMAK